MPHPNLIAAHAEAVWIDDDEVAIGELYPLDPLERLERYGAPVLRIAEEALVP